MAAGRIGREINCRQGVGVLAQLNTSERTVETYVRAARADAAQFGYAIFSALRRRRTLTHAIPTPTPTATIIQNTTGTSFRLVLSTAIAMPCAGMWRRGVSISFGR